jgi:hypothetical protein
MSVLESLKQFSVPSRAALQSCSSRFYGLSVHLLLLFYLATEYCDMVSVHDLVALLPESVARLINRPQKL